MLSLPIVQPPEETEVPLYTGHLTGQLEEHLRQVGRRGLAATTTGGFSYPSKMPCPAWGLPATECRTGSKLAKLEGTTCHACYALKGTFKFKNTVEKYRKRYEGIFHPLWTPSMIFMVRWLAGDYMRLFESGDVRDEHHFKNICTIAAHVRDVIFWMPTREQAVLRACKDLIPPNLTVRLSATRIDGSPPKWWPTTSTVISAQEPGEGICPAPEQGGSCGACRDCWDREVQNRSFRLH